jgi:hypothetical protein
MNKRYTMLGMATWGLLSLPSVALSQEVPVTGDKSVKFPPSYKCSASTPCTNVTGEITRIEETYWVRTPEGREIHLKVTKDTKMEDLPKVGDNIATRLSSTGEADTVVKLDALPKPVEVPFPSHSQEELRQSQKQAR